MPWSLYEDVFVEGLGCWVVRISKVLSSVLFENAKCSGQFLRNQSTHQNKEVNIAKSKKKSIANTMKICEKSKTKKSRRERNFTMSIAITKGFFEFG